MSDNRIQLGVNLDLLAATPLKEEIARHASRDIVLDAGAVERLGAQCLQVLLAARAKWRNDGLSFSVVEPSTQFREHLGLMGATDILNEVTVEEVCS